MIAELEHAAGLVLTLGVLAAFVAAIAAAALYDYVRGNR